MKIYVLVILMSSTICGEKIELTDFVGMVASPKEAAIEVWQRRPSSFDSRSVIEAAYITSSHLYEMSIDGNSVSAREVALPVLYFGIDANYLKATEERIDKLIERQQKQIEKAGEIVEKLSQISQIDPNIITSDRVAIDLNDVVISKEEAKEYSFSLADFTFNDICIGDFITITLPKDKNDVTRVKWNKPDKTVIDKAAREFFEVSLKGQCDDYIKAKLCREFFDASLKGYCDEYIERKLNEERKKDRPEWVPDIHPIAIPTLN